MSDEEYEDNFADNAEGGNITGEDASVTAEGGDGEDNVVTSVDDETVEPV